MATAALPDNPDPDQLRTRARELQRAVRAGEPKALRRAGLSAAEPGYPLSRAQLVLARRYGFTSWPRLAAHVAAIRTHRWRRPAEQPDERATDRYVRAVCVTWSAEDAHLDAAAPPPGGGRAGGMGSAETPRDIELTAVAADVAGLRAAVRADPGAAERPAGVYGWSPLMYLAYSRVPSTEADVLGAARLLLDAGADPNDGRFFEGRPTPFTVLTGVLGGGEGGQPAHPHARALATLLLTAGADPNDDQALYNLMFDSSDEAIALLLEYGLGHGDGGPWRARVPDVLPAPPQLLRGLLTWALVHDQRARVRLLARSGVDLAAPLDDGRGVPVAAGRTPVAVALVNGHRELAAELHALGAPPARLSAVDTVVAALLSGDARTLRSTPADVVAATRAARPGLAAWAGALGRRSALDLLAEAGFDLNALGRGDVPVEQPWQTALHSATERGDEPMVRRLLELGADPAIADSRFRATPAGWAEHFGQHRLLPLLDPVRER